jgi:hypothetical protein
MTIPTSAVTATVFGPDGVPVVGAIVTATLSKQEIYQGVVVPRQVDAVTGQDGTCVLSLWPNGLGSLGGSFYVVRIWQQGQQTQMLRCYVVDATPIALKDTLISSGSAPVAITGPVQVADLNTALATKADASTVTTFVASADVSITAGTDASGNPTATWALTKAGTGTNTPPASGQWNEDLSVIVAQGSAVALTTGAQATIASVTLGPGAYDVGGAMVGVTGAATNISSAAAAINTTASMPAALTERGQWLGRGTGLSAGDSVFAYPSKRIYVAAGNTQTVYLVGIAIFSGGTLSMYGELRVRRLAF